MTDSEFKNKSWDPDCYPFFPLLMFFFFFLVYAISSGKCLLVYAVPFLCPNVQSY